MHRLLGAGLLGGALWLSGCGGTPRAAPTPASSPTSAATSVSTPAPATAAAGQTASILSPTARRATASVGAGSPIQQRPPNSSTSIAAATVSPTGTASAVQTPDRCHTAQLAVSETGTEGAAGHIVDTFSLVNRSGVACTVYGFVGAQMLDAQGAPLPTRVVRNGGLFVTQPGPTEVVLQPAGAATFQAEWSDVPTGDETVCPAAARLEVTPPDETAFLTLDLGRFSLAPCAAGTINVRPLRPPAAAAGGRAEALCVSSDLELGLGGRTSEPTGQHTLSLTLTNRSARSCYLLGYPQVVALDAAGQRLPFDYRQAGDQVVTSRPPRRADLSPGSAAYVTINNYRCDEGDHGTVSTLRLVPPGDAMPLQTTNFGYCGPGQPGSIIFVSPVGATLQDTIH